MRPPIIERDGGMYRLRSVIVSETLNVIDTHMSSYMQPVRNAAALHIFYKQQNNTHKYMRSRKRNTLHNIKQQLQTTSHNNQTKIHDTTLRLPYIT